MTKVNTTTINKDKMLCLALFSIVLSFLCLYVYFLSAAIVHVVIRKEINQDLVALHTEISELETNYIDAQHHVSEKVATLQGYAAVTDKIFINRSGSSLVLSDTRH